MVALAATGWKPESTPPDMGWHGAANVDCVTVWFLGLKTNETVSPTEALTLVGEKASPEAPTWTWTFAAETVEARVARATETREKCIFVFRIGDSKGADDNLIGPVRTVDEVVRKGSQEGRKKEQTLLG